MLRRRPSSVVVIPLLVVACAIVAACSARAAGERCKIDDDCESHTCALNGLCGPGECTCTGEECGKVQASCDEGSVCVAGKGPFELGYNRCRSTCSAAKPCPLGKDCDDGVCDGARPASFSLSWANIPRVTPCEAKVPCEYQVRPPDTVTVASYTWSFDSSATGPTASITYAKAGTYTVTVRAHATDGTEGELHTTETLCVGGLDTKCAPDGAPCCQGSCSAQFLCK